MNQAISRLREEIDFVIIGSMKAGTVTLNHALTHSRDVYMLPGYFSERPNLFGSDPYEPYARYLSKLLYKNQHPDDQTSDRTIEKIGHTKGTYHVNKTALRQIFARPDRKALLTYREPVSRLFSHYNHEIKSGRTRLAFQEWLETDEGKLGLSLSRYGEALSYLSEIAPPESLAVIRFDQTNSTAAIDEVCRFIGVRAPEIEIAAEHLSTMPRAVKWNYFARTLIDCVVPKGNRLYQMANIMRSRIFLGKRRPQALNEDLKRKLSDTFAYDQEKFDKLRPTFEINV